MDFKEVRMKKKKQNRYIYRVYYQTGGGIKGWKRLITRKRMTVARRDKMESILLELINKDRAIKGKPEIPILVVTNVEWVNKIGRGISWK